MNSENNNGLSVIICCYNSSQRINKTIKAIFSQKSIENLKIELLIIDNNSSDNTWEKVKEAIIDKPKKLNVKLLSEKKPGLTNARNCGMKASKYNFLTFVDDDNHLFPDYLNIVYQTMLSNTEIGILGGKGITYNSLKLPTWFKFIQRNYAVGPQGNDQLGLQEVDLVYGAGMTIRKDFWLKILSNGFMPILNDRTKKTLISGGDTELCMVFKIAGYKVFYHPELNFYHDIPIERINWEYVKKLNYGFGQAKTITDIYLHCLRSDKNPANQTKLPLWIDTLIHLYKAHIVFKRNNNISNLEGNLDQLLYIGQKGHLKYITKIRGKYSYYYDYILKLKQSFKTVK